LGDPALSFAMSRRTDRAAPDANAATMESANPNLARIACIGAAAVGALVWALIARFTGYEVGYVAIGVGALTGYACVQASGRGMAMAVTAAIFSLLAIVGGKTLAYRWSIEQHITNLPELRAQYDELLKDAPDWVALGDAPSDKAVEAYLLQHGYQDWEVEPFKGEVAPVLAKFAADEPTYEAWAAERASEYIASLSFKDFYVSDDLKDTLLDVLFLVIGVAAAFNLVMQKSREEVAELQRREERAHKREAVAAATEGEDGEPA
jgi:hypothetical protein